MKNTGERIDWQGMVITTILMIVGFAIIYFTWGEMEITYKNIYNYVYIYKVVLIFPLFFILVGLYCLKAFFSNVVIKPKKETLYLKNVERDIYSFIDSKGKKYMYTAIDIREFNVGKYYIVMKTKNIIKEVLDISNISFPIRKEKTSYWLNFYSPIANFENIYLLPILYVIFLPGFLDFIMANGFAKIYGLMFMLVPGTLIIYDLVYKIKKNKIVDKIEENPNPIQQNNKLNSVDQEPELLDIKAKGLTSLYFIQRISQIIVGLIVSGFCGYVFINGADNITKISAIPFLICGLAVIISGIVSLFSGINEVKAFKENQNNNKYINKRAVFNNLSNIFSKLYIIGFLVFWFGFLVFFTTEIVKQEGSYLYALFSIPFWVIGVVVFYKYIIKNR